MRAIVYDRYGPPEVLQVRELPSPVPREGEVLLRVRAAALNPKDSLVRKGKFSAISGKKFPRLLGYDVAGVVAALGPGITRFKLGDEVYGMKQEWAGGTVAEEVCLLEDELSAKPARLSFEEAAALPLAAMTALQALRDLGNVKHGQRVLINGGSGGVGVFAIQVARALGAHVTTTSSARNLEFCRSLGANETLDYTTNNGLSAGANWDVFFDVFGNRSFFQARRALAPNGTYVSTVPAASNVALHLMTGLFGRSSRLVVVRSKSKDLAQLTQWVEAGALKPVVDRVVPLEDTAAGQAHIETKRARGKVVVRIS
jgi:NADPH:quinone reductase-like Zn-dependent oxidoreductase